MPFCHSRKRLSEFQETAKFDIEGEVEENEPKISREALHEAIGREPDEVGRVGARLVDWYRWKGPLSSRWLNIRYEKTDDHKWVLNRVMTNWIPETGVRPHKDPF